MTTTRRQFLAGGLGALGGSLLRVAASAETWPKDATVGTEACSIHTTDAGEIVTEMTVAGKRARLVPTAGYPKRQGEKWEMPQLIVGPDGQLWLFYASNVRWFTYYHRWLGDGWGPRCDGRGFYFVDPDYRNAFLENYLPIRDFQVRCGIKTVEMTLHSDVWGVADKRLRIIRPPDPEVCGREGVLLLDSSFVAETRGLVRACAAPQKHPANPVFTPSGKAGLPDQMGVMNHGTVLRDEQGRFRMWYSGYEWVGQGPTRPGQNWQEYMHVCYAESDDGIHWRRPELGLLPFAGSSKHNLLPLYLSPVVVEDKADPDPARRFKAAQQVGPYSYPLRSHLQVSPDGVRWRTLVGRREYPGTRPWFFEFNCFFRDDAELDSAKRWKAYGYFATSENRRTSGLATSPDCLTWTGYPENPVIDPRQGRKEHVHDLVVWKEQGLYVGLVQVRDADEHYEFELVFSHDGVHFSRVQDGYLFLPLGGAKDWDCDLMTAASAPVQVGDETWFYYGAKQKRQSEHPAGDAYGWSHVSTSAGLATMKRGRYVGYQAAAGQLGLLRTMPVPLGDRPLRLRVNAACTGHDVLRVSVVDADRGTALVDFDDCQPVVQDGVATAVTWRKPVIAPSAGRVALVFQLTGKARLYGLQFG
jgi:hypothetical protein